jgi:starvation-inducible DNA-binding protein
MSNVDQNLVESLKALLANGYLLLLKTQNYHWNVTGPHFSSLHALFEEQYNDLFAANDEVAERIRALGVFAPGSYKAFMEYAKVSEETDVPKSMDMVKNLANDHKIMAELAQALIEAGEAANDEVSVDMGVQRKTIHEKTHWMLSSHLE